MAVDIRGGVAPGFDRVRDCFAANFERDDAYLELGASLAVYRGQDLVVDLSAGYCDTERTSPWKSGTLANVWSTTKGVTAIAVAVLVDRGQIDYAAPVARYWPQFAQNGKAAITVSQLLSHQAGLPGFVEPTTLEDFYAWPTVSARLASQPPMWEPGTRNSYHAMTFGFLAGELIRRVSGMTVGQFVATQLAGPLNADVFIGLPLSEEHRVASLIAPRSEAVLDPASLAPEALAALINPPMTATLPNQRAWRAAEIPAGNGHASALGLARLYAMLANGGVLGDVRIMRPGTIEALARVQTKRVDIMLGFAPYWGAGVAGNAAGLFGPKPNVFGHCGWGGSFGCADTEAAVSIGYVMNQMGDRIVGDPRTTALCNAIYECV